MNCKLTKDRIDQLVFEKDKHLMFDVSEHIKNCEPCRTYFKRNQTLNGIISLVKKEPVLHRPAELTNSILTAIDNTEQLPEPNTNIRNGKAIRLITLTLAAASISLMLIFVVEQYLVLGKISKLENQVSQVSERPIHTNFDNIIRYNTGMQVSTIQNILKKDFIKQGFQNFKSRIMFARLSAIAMNEGENEIIFNQDFIREHETMSDTK